MSLFFNILKLVILTLCFHLCRLFKVFKSKPAADFVLHSIDFETPQTEPLKDGDKVWATIEFESQYDCQIWMIFEVKVEDSEKTYPCGGYMPSDVLPAGRHRLRRYFYLNGIDINDFPNGVTINGANIYASRTNNDVLFNETMEVNYVYLGLPEEDLAQRKKVDTENLHFEFVSVRCAGQYLSPNDAISVDATIKIRIHAECNEEVKFSCQPITDSSYGFDPLSYPDDGVLDSDFTMHETGAISGFTITAYNRYNIVIGSTKVDFPLQVEDWHGDGCGGETKLAFDFIYDDEQNEEGSHDLINQHSKLPYDKQIRLYTYTKHQAKHGAILHIYDMVNGEIGEKMATSVKLTYEKCQQDDYNLYFDFDWTGCDFSDGRTRYVSGFYLVLTNIAGDVLAEEEAKFELRIQPPLE